MVIHDREREEQWTVQRQARQKAKKSDTKKASRPISVLGVQSLACGVILLVVLLFRIAGGNAYTQLQQSFSEAMAGNELMAVFMRLLDEEPLASSSLSEEAVKDESLTPSSSLGRLPPAGALAVGIPVTQPAVLPLSKGQITSSYGYRKSPFSADEEFHRGVDIAAPVGTPLAAIFSGEITAVGEDTTLGKYIVLTCGQKLEILYAHCNTILAPEGSVVRAGEHIATVGATGQVTGSHVHIQVSCADTVYNPADTIPLTMYV